MTLWANTDKNIRSIYSNLDFFEFEIAMNRKVFSDYVYDYVHILCIRLCILCKNDEFVKKKTIKNKRFKKKSKIRNNTKKKYFS